MKAAKYLEEIELLQIELVKMQAWVKEVGERIVLIFEGRDAARQGGTIQRFTENLNPRGAKVVALAKPSDTERGQWYFQRYIEKASHEGQIVFFDRSWYNRAGVEHVMGFCTPHEYLEFMRQTPEFERMMVRSGIRLYKLWFSVSREEQLRRFLGRAQDPLKQWETQSDGCGLAGPLGSLYQGQGSDAFLHRHRGRAVGRLYAPMTRIAHASTRDQVRATHHSLCREGHGCRECPRFAYHPGRPRPFTSMGKIPMHTQQLIIISRSAAAIEIERQRVFGFPEDHFDPIRRHVAQFLVELVRGDHVSSRVLRIDHRYRTPGGRQQQIADIVLPQHTRDQNLGYVAMQRLVQHHAITGERVLDHHSPDA